ncbi:MAG: hypothetical protein WA902_06220 [Thermosynechococcaceae cyanobacterium]
MSNPNDPRYINPPEEQARRELDQRLKERDDENTSRGVLIGVLAVVAVGLGALVWGLLSQPKENPAVVPIPVPEAKESPSSSPTPPEIKVNITQPAPDVNTEVTAPPTQPAPQLPPEVQQPAPEPQQAPPSTAPKTETAPSSVPSGEVNQPPQTPE